jgi:hypothetical protein
LWDGDSEPTGPFPAAAAADLSGIAGAGIAGLSGIAGALRVFVDALRNGAKPMGEVHENLMSLAMVEAAVQSSRVGAPVRLDDVLEQAHRAALRDETRPDVRAALAAWHTPARHTVDAQIGEV